MKMKGNPARFFLVCLSSVLVVWVGACSKKALNNDDISGASYLSPKIEYVSTWKHFSVKHPTGFWQLLKHEKWTLLYNNQDAAVQMIVDAKRNIFMVPSVQSRLASFYKSLKLKHLKELSSKNLEIEGVKAVEKIVEGDILFDFWEKFRVKRKIRLFTFRYKSCTYILAYLAEASRYEQYMKDFDLLVTNFSFVDKAIKKKT